MPENSALQKQELYQNPVLYEWYSTKRAQMVEDVKQQRGVPDESLLERAGAMQRDKYNKFKMQR